MLTLLSKRVYCLVSCFGVFLMLFVVYALLLKDFIYLMAILYSSRKWKYWSFTVGKIEIEAWTNCQQKTQQGCQDSLLKVSLLAPSLALNGLSLSEDTAAMSTSSILEHCHVPQRINPKFPQFLCIILSSFLGRASTWKSLHNFEKQYIHLKFKEYLGQYFNFR